MNPAPVIPLRDLEPSDVQGVTLNVELWVVAIGRQFDVHPTEAAAKKAARETASKNPGQAVTVLRPVAEIRATVNVEEKAL